MYKILLLPLTIMFFLMGCSNITQTVNPVSIHQTLKNDDMNIFNSKYEKNQKTKKYEIKIIPNKSKFKEVIKEYNNNNPYNKLIIDEGVKNDFVLKYKYTFKNIDNFIDYVNATLNKNINITRISGTIYKLNEDTTVSKMFKESYLINTSVLDFMDIPFSLKGETSYNEILNIIQKDFNIPIIIKENSISKVSSSSSKSDSSSSTITKSNLKNRLKTDNITNYSGTIKKIIQRIAIEEKLFINYKDGIIILSDHALRLFELKIPSIDYKTQEIFKDMTSVELNPYDDLKKQLDNVIINGTFNINKSTGHILINANYDELRHAQILLKDFYNVYNKTIDMDVYIYEVNLNKDNKFGVSFDSNMMAKVLGLNPDLAASLNIDLGNVNSDTSLSGIALGKNYAVPKGQDAKFNKFFLKFLNNFGNTRILTKPKLETINTIPVSMKITTSQDYVSSIDETSTTDTNSNTTSTNGTTNIQTDTIESGFTLGLYPMAENDGKIKILLKPEISQLLDLTPYKYGSTDNPKTVQLVTKSKKDFSQVINIKNNEVAIISGYIYETNKANKDTLPWMDSTKDSVLDPLLSTKKKKLQRTEMIIAIKARIKE